MNLPVHPHGRGDNNYNDHINASANGSPPRAWGQYHPHRGRRDCRRFTPTGVGTIRAGSLVKRFAAVHPHGRGDNYHNPHRLSIPNGSPPRAWGQSPDCCLPETFRRFTPTGVGTIVHQQCHNTRSSVHPHGRGDNDALAFEFDVAGGSPPRAWGQLPLSFPQSAAVRFTPTGVGTMCRASFGHRCTPVHPHGRGDNLQRAAELMLTAGSPPRAWGQ